MKGADGDDMVLDFSNSPDRSRPSSSHGDEQAEKKSTPNVDGTADESNSKDTEAKKESAKEDAILPEPLQPSESMQPSITKGLSQKGLWGSQPKGATPERKSRHIPKRRWTVDQE
jgi:hypothetical protein